MKSKGGFETFTLQTKQKGVFATFALKKRKGDLKHKAIKRNNEIPRHLKENKGGGGGGGSQKGKQKTQSKDQMDSRQS